MKTVALIGYSGHAFVVAYVLRQSGYKLIGYFEKKSIDTNLLQLDYLGFEGDEDFKLKIRNTSVFPAIGNNQIRKRIMMLIMEKGIRIALAVSPKANLSNHIKIGTGTLVCPGVCINPFTIVGTGVILNTGAIIEHECSIGDFAHIAPGAVLAGNVHIGELSFIGANSVVKQGIKIGENVIIGAGAVVLKNIPDNEIWIGNPAKRVK